MTNQQTDRQDILKLAASHPAIAAVSCLAQDSPGKNRIVVAPRPKHERSPLAYTQITRALADRYRVRLYRRKRAASYPQTFGFALLLFASLFLVAEASADEPNHAWSFAEIQLLLKKSCIDCHNADDAAGEVDLEQLSGTGVLSTERFVWTRVYKQLKVGAMPPEEKLDEATRAKTVQWLDEQLNYVDLSKPINPGHVTARRLNKEQYDRTIQDLFGIRLSLSNRFPSDDVGYGFDNIGDVHTVSPLRMEMFLEAAERISDFLVHSGRQLEMNRNEQAVFYNKKNTLRQSGAGLIFDPDSGLDIDFDFPLPGEYSATVRVFGLMPDSIFEATGVDQKQTWPEHHNAFKPGDEQPPLELQVMLDGREILRSPIEQQVSSRTWQTCSVRFSAPMGLQNVSFHVVPPAKLSGKALKQWEIDPPRIGIKDTRIKGPYSVETPKLSPLHRVLLEYRPSKTSSPQETMTEIIRRIGPRVWRRPMSESEVSRLTQFALASIDENGPFEDAIENMLQAMLCSHPFLFIQDSKSWDVQSDTIAPLSHHAVASRLSYFLWNSMPDEQLFELADAGKLQDETVLREQVTRMLANPRSDAFREGFFRQWLDLRKLDHLPIEYKNKAQAAADIKAAAETETLMFVNSLIEKNASVGEMLTAKYTFLDSRIAELYGIKGIKGKEFQRVSLDDHPRQGILTHPSLLMLTSYPNRTSPTKRGNWILEAILGDAPPDPPPGVPDLSDTEQSNPDATLREHLQRHRSDPACASCHQVMDSIGLGLDNYDRLGRWREKDERGNPLDVRGELPGSGEFDGPVELLTILSQRETEFVENFTRKLLTYALGRGLEYYDRIAIENILKRTSPDTHRINDIVTEVVLSRPFRYQTGNRKKE